MSSGWSKCEKLGCVTTNWHQQEHEDLGGVTYSDTRKNSKIWLVTQQNGTRASRLGLCHNKWTPARCKNTTPGSCHKTLVAARIPRLDLCHKTLTSARIPRFELCHKTLASARIPRLELCHKTLASARTPRLELSQLHIDSNKNTKTRAVSPTLTSVTTPWLGLRHLHWHQ